MSTDRSSCVVPRSSFNEALSTKHQEPPFGMTVEEQVIWGLLGHGRERAIGAAWLSRMVGVPERRIRQVIRHLVMQHNILIATAVDDPAGFYIAIRREEVEHATKSLRHRGIMILMRAAKLSKISLEEIFHQGRLELQGRGSRVEGRGEEA
jgi:hypothetical protein